MVKFNQLSRKLEADGMLEIIQVAASWQGAGTSLLALSDATWFTAIIEVALEQRPELAQFDGETHWKALGRFRELDRNVLRQNRVLLAAKHWEQLPKYAAGGELGVLRREFEKKRRHLPVRQLIEKAGTVIQHIKPVLMMSPLSIAKFVPRDSLSFDTVIFDEASQIQPVDSFGAILRARQAVVVGDSKQLPPTTFFERLAEESDQDESTRDLESVLGLFCAQGAPQRMLRWHYRSRHESLITVSNSEFYDNQLVLFPSPDWRKASVGLEFRHLPETEYEPGTGKRFNVGEAQEVARAVMDHALANPELTLGVAAFSQSQAQMIEDQLEMLRRNDTSLEPFFASHAEEPFFVKNLESVQGDERDVIFISVGYGKRAGGYMSMSFGPLNWDGGERRLNVLITRARCRCVVFSNFRADDIDLSRSRTRGVAALKRYLKYAETGIQDLPQVTERDLDSPFEEHVASELTKRGYDVRPQVGSGGFFIDLAVVDPDMPGRFMLGIECDGATYHSARSARDRDRLRQQVLEGLGWTIHRIWSTDWFRNPQRELERVVASIERAKLSPSPPIPRVKVQPAVERTERTPQADIKARPYGMATIRVWLAQTELHMQPVYKLAEWVKQVVEVEGPVHIDEVARRITNAAGFSRVGRRIREAVQRGAQDAVRSGQVRRSGDFLFPVEMEATQVRDRSSTPAALKKIGLVAPEEIQQALLLTIQHSYGIDQDEALRTTARLLGFHRVGSDVLERIGNLLGGMIAQGMVKQDGDHLQISLSNGSE